MQGKEYSAQHIWLGVHVFGWEQQEKMASLGGCTERDVTGISA